MIYTLCLVTAEMIPLSNLQNRISQRPARLQLGLSPSILLVNRQVSVEAMKFLYGWNTFFVDLLSSWTCTGVRGISRFRNRQICVKCSRTSLHHDRATQIMNLTPRKIGTLPVSWNPRVRFVRRLQISLRSYSFQQWRKFNDIASCISDGCNPAWRCLHQYHYAVPPVMHLDLLILHIREPGVLNAEDVDFLCTSNSCAAEYIFGRSAAIWRKHVQKDMRRELCWLLSFARGQAETVVMSNSGGSLALEEVATSTLLGRARSLRHNRLATVRNKIPPRFRRSGQLAQIHPPNVAKKPPSEGRESLGSWQVDHVSLMPGLLRDSGVMFVSHGGADLIYDAI